MKKNLLLLFIALLVINSINNAQENKFKPSLFGDFKGFFDMDLTNHTEYFSLNAARMGVKGSISDFISYKVLVNFANIGSLSQKKDAAGKVTDVKAKFAEVLQDAMIKYSFDKNLSATFGQYKIPFSTDNLRAPLELDFINRNLTTKITPELRDVGGMFSYVDKDAMGLELHAGLFNGSGANKLESDHTLNKSFRFVIKPTKEISVSANYYNGKLNNAFVDIFDFGGTLNIGGFKADVEYALRKTDTLDVKRNGFSYQGYVLYTLPVEAKYFVSIQPAVRFEYLEPNNLITDDELTKITAGFSFILNENVLNQVKLNYEFTDYKLEGRKSISRVYLGFQAAFN
ncbi:MAG TPA: porin [Melioribacteraceae bacterium]|nr:porin [Melioribacteraceae bacterium]